MIIHELGISNDPNIRYDNLLGYLSKELFLLQNDRVRKSFIRFKECEMEFISVKQQIRYLKDCYKEESKEFNRQRSLTRVVNLIETLKKEGILEGDNKSKILSLLRNLKSLNITNLANLEEDLSVYTAN